MQPGELLIVCAICGVEFINEEKLARHKELMHPADDSGNREGDYEEAEPSGAMTGEGPAPEESAKEEGRMPEPGEGQG